MRFAEQEELVRLLEAKQAQQSRRWRVRFRFPIPSAWRYGRRDLPWAQGSGLCLDLAISCSHHLLFCAARLRGVPPRLRGLPCLLQFPPCLVSWELVGSLPLSTILPFVMFIGHSQLLMYCTPAIIWDPKIIQALYNEFLLCWIWIINIKIMLCTVWFPTPKV